ncbi:MAG: tRNA (cytidine(34)-2'-O)-methyltransferase [bacterium]
MRIILVNPEIPPNTGSIGRLCAATSTQLVLVEPLGFSLEDRYLKRAGLDYWPWIDVTVVDHYSKAFAATPGTNYLFTAHATRPYTDAAFTDDDALVFGCESVGLSPEALAAEPPEHHLRIPMDTTHVRSLNLAQCAALTLYEARRQLGRT